MNSLVSASSELTGSYDKFDVPFSASGECDFPNLGNNAKCSYPLNSELPTETKATSKKPPPQKIKELDRQTKRLLSYLLQSVSRKLHLQSMPNIGDPIQTMDDAHRVCKCNRVRVQPNVTIYKSTKHRNCFYGGLSRCASVWDCPPCSTKIQERRRGEVSHGMDWGYENGYIVSMFTFTFPHYAYQTCSELLEKQALAFKHFRSGRPWQKKKKSIGFLGLIRGLEVNHGKNGWHPHTHELWFHRPMKQQEQLAFQKYISERWLKSCKKFGLVPTGKTAAFRKYAVDVKYCVSNSEYLNKMDDQSSWGADRETVKSSVKETLKGRPPFALLSDNAKGCDKSGQLFLEYSKSFFSKSQLYWSTGLKTLCGIKEYSNQELADQKDDKADTLMNLEQFAWQTVLDSEFQGELLNLAENGGYDAVYDWLKKRGYHDIGIETY